MNYLKAMTSIKVGIAGGTGYTGSELLRLLSGHPKAEICVVTSNSCTGKKIAVELPALTGQLSLSFEKTESDSFDGCDVVFSCLPHGASAELVAKASAQFPKTKFIDLSADFRLDGASYKQWYGGHDHPAPDLLSRAAYGLPELNRATIAKANVVANPGCYPTGALLALAPLAKLGLVSGPYIVDSKSGVSGAGKEPSRGAHFPDTNEALRPYNVGKHRHAPEIAMHLSAFAGKTASVSFTPHLVPMNRGILTTAYAKPAPGVTVEDIRAAYDKVYADEPFVHHVEEVDVKNVRGSNSAHVNAWQNGDFVVFASAIDNLVKGASGQAIQNMNLLFGHAEDIGLPKVGITP
jgi:N-acetyl-gamma-glutamyl-phosphate reductase